MAKWYKGVNKVNPVTVTFNDTRIRASKAWLTGFFSGVSFFEHGDCGYPLVDESDALIGIVAARGERDRAIFSYFTKSDVDEAEKFLYAKVINNVDLQRGNFSLKDDVLESYEKFEGFSVVSMSHRSFLYKIPADSHLACRLYGTMENFHDSRNRSPMRKTPCYDDIVRAYPYIDGMYGLPVPDVKMLDGVPHSPFSRMILNVSLATDVGIDNTAWKTACVDYLKQLRRHTGGVVIKSLSFEQAVRGVVGMPMMSGSTSSGIGAGGRKDKYYIRKPKDDDPDYFELDELCYAMRANIEEDLVDGVVPTIVAKVFLKLNEVRTVEKIEKAGTRTINCLNFVFNNILRQYFGPIIIALNSFPLAHESRVGVNLASIESTRSLQRLSQFGDNACIDGDFSHMDDSETCLKIRSALGVLVDWAALAGYDSVCVRKCRILIESLVNIIFIVRGDLIMMSRNSSGHFLTTVVNSLIVSLMLRYCYFRANPSACVFEESVYLETYGDDNRMAVAEFARLWFNFDNIKKYCYEAGMIYTTANKGDSGVFKQAMDCSFLRRRFKLSEFANTTMESVCRGEGVVLAPIEEESILKMLSWWEPSTFLPQAQQLALILENAQREYWMYGRVVFNEKTVWLKEMSVKHGVEFLVQFFDYDQYYLLFIEGKFVTSSL
jgi:hypothetical protein